MQRANFSAAVVVVVVAKVVVVDDVVDDDDDDDEEVVAEMVVAIEEACGEVLAARVDRETVGTVETVEVELEVTVVFPHA